MILTGKNGSTGEKPVAMPLYAPQMCHGLAEIEAGPSGAGN